MLQNLQHFLYFKMDVFFLFSVQNLQNLLI